MRARGPTRTARPGDRSAGSESASRSPHFGHVPVSFIALSSAIVPGFEVHDFPWMAAVLRTWEDRFGARQAAQRRARRRDKAARPAAVGHPRGRPARRRRALRIRRRVRRVRSQQHQDHQLQTGGRSDLAVLVGLITAHGHVASWLAPVSATRRGASQTRVLWFGHEQSHSEYRPAE